MSHTSRKKEPANRALRLDWQTIERYIASLAENKKTGTVQNYTRALRKFYDDLPESKRVDRSTLPQWKEKLQASDYTVKTINERLVVANGFMNFWGHREFQCTLLADAVSENLPRLTRDEYLQMLIAARRIGKHRLYLLIKLLGNTDIQLNELPLLTVERLTEDQLTDGTKTIRIPEALRQELLDYALQQEIDSGMVFQTKAGRKLDRSNITRSMKQLCEDAGIPEEKANPRCLRRMWQEEQQRLQAKAIRMVWKMQDQMLASEEQAVAYEQDQPRG